jgi:uncharacterized membrane protein
MADSVKNFFTKDEREDIRQAILNAELDTSGEIRVHIEDTCTGEVLDRASDIFKKLKMHKTEKRNGVLFYLAVKNRKFAVLGDKGINAIVEEDFWDDIKASLLDHFREEEYAEGLVKGIEMVGTKLKNYFPFRTDDVNELPDEISFGKEEKKKK